MQDLNIRFHTLYNINIIVINNIILLSIQDKWTYTNALIYKNIQLDYTQCTQNANYINANILGNYSRIYRPTLFSKYTGINYIHYMLLVVPNTEAALPCWSAMDTLSGEGMRGTGCHV